MVVFDQVGYSVHGTSKYLIYFLKIIQNSLYIITYL